MAEPDASIAASLSDLGSDGAPGAQMRQGPHDTQLPGITNGIAGEITESAPGGDSESEGEEIKREEPSAQGATAEGEPNASKEGVSEESTLNAPTASDAKQAAAPEDRSAEKTSDKSKNTEELGSKPKERLSVLDQLSPLRPPEVPVFVGDSKNAELVKSVNQVVNSAVSSLAGKGRTGKGSPNVNAADLTPEDWDRLFKMTGLFQGYDIDENHPRSSMEPLFVLGKNLPTEGGSAREGQEGGANKTATKTGTPEETTVRRGGVERTQLKGNSTDLTAQGGSGGGGKDPGGNAQKGRQEKDVTKERAQKPAFLPHDKMGITVETTHTERTRFFLESGFTSADLSITVPYVAASVEAKQTETWAKKKATRTVYFTAKAEFPRCRIDIRSCLEQGYLEINPKFVDRVAGIWAKLKAREEELGPSGVHTLDGKADDQPDELERRWQRVNAIEGNSTEAVEKAADVSNKLRREHVKIREQEALEIAKLDEILKDVKDLLQQFGAVWVEQITLGGQIYRTSKEELTWEESTVEKSESIKSSVKAAAAGGGAGVGAMFGTAQKSGQSDSAAGNQLSHQAIGGDTLLYNPDDPNEWLDSVKNPHHWRAIRFQGVKKLTDLPGLKKVYPTTYKTVPGSQGCPRPVQETLHEMLTGLLERAELSTKYAAKKAQGPRRILGEAWIHDLEGCWYGCYTWHKSLTQIPGAQVMTMEIERPAVKRFTAATSGVESAYIHRLEIKGTGHDDKGRFTLDGSIMELENKLRRYKNTPYEILGVVEINKHYVKSSQGAKWHGASTLKYAAERLDYKPPQKTAGGCFSQPGCLSRFCQPGCRNVYTQALEVTDQSKDHPGSLDDRARVAEGVLPEPVEKEEDKWVYRGHLDRLGMHGYWMFQGPTVKAKVPDANQHEPEFAQEGGTWTLAPVDELPRFDDLYKIYVGSPLPGPEIPVRLTEFGCEIKVLLKVAAEYNLYVQRAPVKGFNRPLIDQKPKKEVLFPDNKMLKEVLKDVLTPEELEDPSANVMLTTDMPPPDSQNGVSPEDYFARVTTKEGSTPQKAYVLPQSVQETLKTLQKLPGFGKGVLRTKFRTILDDGEHLKGGAEYVFVPEGNGNPGVARAPQDPWNFVEREDAISEPRRRWILPPDAHVSPEGLPSERPLSIDRLMGTWQGFVVEDFHPGNLLAVGGTVSCEAHGGGKRCADAGCAKLAEGATESDVAHGQRPVAAVDSHTRADWRTKRGIGKKFAHEERKKDRSEKVLPPPVYTRVTTCNLVGGSVGHAKYVVKGRAWQAIKCVPKWLAPSFRLEGTLTQVPVARPNDDEAKHSYPILAKVEAIGVPVFLCVRVPFARKRFFKGHLDHLGMHGFTGRVGVPELRGTFGFMPVQSDVDGRRKVEQAKEKERQELERRKKSAGRSKRFLQFLGRVDADETE